MIEEQATVEPTTLPGPGTVLAGRFRLQRRVGSGGIGTVWRAIDLELQRPVAIKLLHPHLASRTDVAERFRIEALATARLAHPNVLRVFDAGHSDGVAYLVTEFVTGTGIDRFVSEGPLDPLAVAAIGLQSASALAAAHDAGMTHRDVKPSNLLLDGTGRIKLIDFGIAKVADLASDLTAGGETVGSWAYLAPEQLNSLPVGPAADVYALGLVLWEACTGHAPFTGDTPSAIALARLTRPVPSLPDLPELPPELRDVIEEASATEPSDRPDAPTMVRRLTELTGPRPHQHLVQLGSRRGRDDRGR